MQRFKKILYYVRLLLFIVSLIFIFMMIGTIVKVGLFGYIYLILEFIYITVILSMILSKKDKYKKDIAFNGMQIGMYIYTGIVLIRTFNWRISLISLSSYEFYRNNCLILSVLLITLLFYAIAISIENNNKNKLLVK